MQVSGVGVGLGGGAAAGAAGTLGTPMTPGAGGLPSQSLGASAPAGLEGMNASCDSVREFDAARFLFALLILAALGKSKDDDDSGAAAGFLAGLMAAGAFDRFGGAGNGGGLMQGLSAVGGALDVTA